MSNLRRESRNRSNYDRFFFFRGKGRNRRFDCDWSSDVCSSDLLMIKRTLWNQLNGFDRRFFMYAEEADLCLRAKKLGYSPMICGAAQIVHYGGGSEKVRADKMVRLLSAKIELQKVHWSEISQRVGVFLFKSWVVTRMIAYSVLALKGRQSRYVDAQRIWQEIWIRRHEWSKGY